MSRTRTRARNRRAHRLLTLDQQAPPRGNLAAEFQRALRRLWSSTSSSGHVEAMEHFLKLIRRIARSDMPLWRFEYLLLKGGASFKLDSEEYAEIRAIFSQTVARRLAGMTPGNVHRRHALGESVA